MPVLIEHFMEHEKLNPDMTLEAFLKTHYCHPVKDADYKTDRKLPFIAHSVPLTLVFIIGSSFTLDISNHVPRQIERHGKIPVYNDAYYNSGYLNSIWEPPRNS